MAKFTGVYEGAITIDAPIDKVRAHFSNLDAIVAAYGALERHEKLDDNTLRYYLKPVSALGVTFEGKYDCRYESPSENVLVWNSVGSGANIETHAKMTFTQLGENRTRVEYKESMTCEIKINRLVGKALKPIVDRDIANGCKNFLKKMKDTISTSLR